MDDQTDPHRLAERLIANARDLEPDLDWLARTLQQRLAAYFATPSTRPVLPDEGEPPPELADSDSPWAEFVQRHALVPAERLLVLLALAPHLRPQLLDVLWVRNPDTQRPFPEFGGQAGPGHGPFLPTAETAAFLLGADALAARFVTLQMLERGGRLARLDVLHLDGAAAGEPATGGALQVSRRFLGLVTCGVETAPAFDADFPARRVHTTRPWSDLVLPAATLEQLDEIRHWITHGRALLDDWGLRGRTQPGYTCLFSGPPGTGKTLSACLLGRRCGCEVYKVDLSLVVSKYIGETEKNLGRVFDQAEHRGWILFFDEADALFGKRTRVDDAHDRHANQEVSFLLQRIEEFDGVVILSTNLRANIDEAFLRRFQSVVQFQVPRAQERRTIWRAAFPSRVRFEPGLDLDRLAERHELCGGTIANVARHACLRALARGDECIRALDVQDGLRRELMKEGRAF